MRTKLLVLQASAHAWSDRARTPEEVKQCIRQNFQDLGEFPKAPSSMHDHNSRLAEI